MISKYIYMIKDLSYIPNPLTLTHSHLIFQVEMKLLNYT